MDSEILGNDVFLPFCYNVYEKIKISGKGKKGSTSKFAFSITITLPGVKFESFTLSPSPMAIH